MNSGTTQLGDITERLKGSPEVLGLEFHRCFSCLRRFDPYKAEPCLVCGWLKCVECGCCLCALPKEAQVAVEAVFETFCLSCMPKAKCVLNPKKKRRKKRLVTGWTREDFLSYVKTYFPSLARDYEAGRINFEKLKLQIETETGLVWKIV